MTIVLGRALIVIDLLFPREYDARTQAPDW